MFLTVTYIILELGEKCSFFLFKELIKFLFCLINPNYIDHIKGVNRLIRESNQTDVKVIAHSTLLSEENRFSESCDLINILRDIFSKNRRNSVYLCLLICFEQQKI